MRIDARALSAPAGGGFHGAIFQWIWQRTTPTVRWNALVFAGKQFVFSFFSNFLRLPRSRQHDDAERPHFRQVFEIRYFLLAGYSECIRAKKRHRLFAQRPRFIGVIHDRRSFAG